MKIINPSLAGLLNLIFPGLGLAYAGEWGRMLSEILEILLFVLLWLFGVFLLGLLGNTQKILYFNVGFLVIYALAMFLDGRQAAEIHNRQVQAH